MLVTNSLTGGGAERSMNLIANELTRRGWRVSIVPINFSPPDQVIPICDVFPLQRRWKGHFINTILAMLRFNRIVTFWKPEIIVLNCDLPELFGATLFGRHNLVVVEHSSTPWGNRAILGQIVRKVLTLRKTSWVSVSSHLTIWPTKNAPTVILQNPILQNINVQSVTVDEETSRLVFIGRLSREKRPVLALEISKRVGIELAVIGEGSLRRELEIRSNQENIAAQFYGHLENPWSEIRAGDLLIVPSSFEGDGLVIIEGLQRQRPMLLADIPDLRRFDFPDVNYCLDVESFVVRIRNFQSKLRSLLIPSEKRDSILNSRSISVVGSSWENFLRVIDK